MMRCLWGVVLIVAFAAVGHWYGPIGATRLSGALFAIIATYMAFAPEIPFYAGRHFVCTFKGWKKIFVSLPAVCLGLTLVFYAPEVTCISSKYKHLCA